MREEEKWKTGLRGFIKENEEEIIDTMLTKGGQTIREVSKDGKVITIKVEMIWWE